MKHRDAAIMSPVHRERLLPFTLVIMATALSAWPGYGQDNLGAMLERGHVVDWLVCGPFASDLDEGILMAATAGRSPLGARDYMAPLGGVTSLRPRHLLSVANNGVEALWQRAAGDGPVFDLKPFFPEADVGVAYGAFYMQADGPTSVMFDLQSALGARFWMNGYPFRDIRPYALPGGGRERFVASFPAGLNLVVMQLPGAHWEALARASDQDPGVFTAAMRESRPLLSGDSGFAFALTMKPAMQASMLFVVPELEDAGTFSGPVAAPRQDMLLTLHNPTGVHQAPARITVTGPDQTVLLVQDTPPPAPYAVWEETLAIPISGYAPDDPLPVDVSIAVGEAVVSFTETITVLAPGLDGATYAVVGPGPSPRTNPNVRPAVDVGAFAQYLILAEGDDAFGFDYGPVTQWLPALIACPELGDVMLRSVAAARGATRAAYEYPDQRLVGGETLLRNTVYGVLAARARLRDERASVLLWRMPGVAPQYPQMLRRMGIAGLAGNLQLSNLYPWFDHLALDGFAVPHRRLHQGVAPDSVEALGALARERRRESMAMDIGRDILVYEHSDANPAPFLLGAAGPLADALPPVLFDGGGVHRIFEHLATLGADARARIPTSAPYLDQGEPGSVVAQSEVKSVHARIESQVVMAEKFATFAALLGAEYPETVLDKCWRLLFYNGAPWRLGLTHDETTWLDMLAAYREAAALSREALDNSLAYIAGQANTLGAAPFVETGVSTYAVLVFNPTPHARTAPCAFTIELGRAPGVTLVDDMDEPVPFVADPIERTEDGFIRRARIHFPARDIPALGYATYYVKNTGAPQRYARRNGHAIENDSFRVEVSPETGDIIRISDKRSGTRYDAGPMNRVLFLAQDAARVHNGRDLWADGASTSGLQRPTRIHIEEGEWLQQLIIENPYSGGVVRRRITLQEGMPRIDCALEMEGTLPPNGLAALSFALDDAGRAPVFGERHGAVQGKANARVHDMRVQPLDNRSLAGAQPALHWFASCGADYVEAANRGRLPLGPVLLIHGEDANLIRAARDLARVLITRGIPATVRPDALDRDSTAYTDSTVPEHVDLDGDHVWRFVIGGPAQNRHTDRLLDTLTAAQRASVVARIAQGATLLLDDPYALGPATPLPALVFAGEDAARSARLAGRAAESLAAGALALPAMDVYTARRFHEPANGLALLFNGPRLCAQEPDGGMFLALDADAGVARDYPMTRQFQYAIVPFDGDWRDADIAGQAHAFIEPLQTTVIAPAQGIQPRRQSFLEVAAPGFVATAVKPAEYPLAEFRSAKRHPRDGFVVRGFESRAASWRGALRLFQPIIGASVTDPFERPGLALTPENTALTLHAGPGAIESWWLLPRITYRSGPADILARTAPPGSPVFSRYWLHGQSAPETGFAPLSVALDGDIAANPTQLDAYVVNHLTDAAVEGVLYLRATALRIEETAHYYALEPGEMFHLPVAATRIEDAPTPPALVAYTHYLDHRYYDALHGIEAPVTMGASRTLAQVRVELENHSGIEIQGMLEVITPPHFWPELGGGAETTLLPGKSAVVLPPQGAQTFYFAWSEPDAVAWTVVKYAGHGQTLYQRLPE